MAKKFKPGSYMLPLTSRVSDLEEEVFNDDNTNDSLREKARSVAGIKKVSELQGKPVTSTEIAKSLQSLANTVIGRINQITLSTTKNFLPINSQIQQINDLLNSKKENDQERAFDLIDKLQSRLGIDLSKYSKEIGTSVQKLYDMNKMRKEDKAEVQRVHTEKIDELKKEREILRERGVNTYINEKNYKLELKTKVEQKQELKEILKEEKSLKEREKELQFEEKQITKEKIINTDRLERWLADNENLTKDQVKLQERKEKAGLKPDERVQGFLSQTFGAAFLEFKNFGKEIKQLGGDLFKGFKNLPSLIGNFAKGIGSGALTVGRFVGGLAVGAGKFLLFGLAIGLIIFGIYKLYQGIMTIVNKVKSFFGFGGDKEKEKIENQPKTTTENETNISPSKKIGETEKFLNPEGKVKDLSKDEFDKLSNNDKDLYVKSKYAEQQGLLPITSKPTIQPIPKDTNVNKMSTDLAATKEEAKTANTVVAPTSQIVNNNNTTQSLSLTPPNPDRSFINLNNVAI